MTERPNNLTLINIEYVKVTKFDLNEAITNTLTIV